MNTTKDSFLSDRAYNYIKRIVQVILPALGTLYVTLAQIWGLPAPEAVAGTILALATFLGVMLGISSARYQPYAGDLVIDENEGENPYMWLDLNELPEDFTNKDEVLMRVKYLK